MNKHRANRKKAAIWLWLLMVFLMLQGGGSKGNEMLTAEAAVSDQAALEHGGGNAVTPQQFGALADGIHDDGPALQKALESGNPVVLVSDLYLFSGVSVWDHNVSLNGNGHVLYCDGKGVEICATLNDDPSSAAAIVTENKPYYGTYHRGYVSYGGSGPLTENLGEVTVGYFHEYQAYLSDLTIIARNFDGQCGLELKRMCKSVVRNVRSICEEGSDGEVGIHVHNCYQVRLEGCHAQNWTASNTCDRGYGIEADGNDIVITGCTAFGNKHDICICSGRNIFSTDIRVNDCKVGCVYDPNAYRADGSKKYQARFDIHGAGERVFVNNLDIAVEAAGPDTIFASLRAPKAELNGMTLTGDAGYVVFAELADSFTFTGLRMENMDLYGGFRPEESIRELRITDGVLNGFARMGPHTKVYLEGVSVRDQGKSARGAGAKEISGVHPNE